MDRPSIDAERLAALMDGALSESERNVVLQSLASSPDSLAILAESAAVAREIDQPSSERASGFARRRTRWRRTDAIWLAAAGLAGVAALSWGVNRQGRGAGDPSAFAKDLARQGATIPNDWRSLGATGASLRGGEVVSDSQRRAARIGADISDLTVALAAHDTRAASIANGIAALLESSPAGVAAAPTAALFRQLGAESALNDSTVAALTRAARSAAELTDANVVRAGAWIEAARLAAHRTDSTFFRTKGSRDMLEQLMSAAWLDDAGHEAARDIASQVRSPTPDWASLGDRLTTLFAAVAGSS